MKNLTHKISSHIFIKFGYFGFVGIAGLFLIYCINVLIIPLLASVLLTLLLDPVVNYFETKGIKRINVILGIYILILFVAAIALIFIVPTLISEAQSFMRELPRIKTTFKTSIDELHRGVQDKFPQAVIPDFYTTLKQQLPAGDGINVDAIMAYMSSFFAILSLLVVIPIVTFFLLADGHLIQKAILCLIPNTYFEMSVLLFHKIISALKFFIRGQLIDAAAVGIMTAIGLAVIGLPYFLVIGIIAGLGNMIPYLGPIIGFLPALFIVVISPEGATFWSVLSIVIVFVMVQFIEGTFIYPIAVGKSVSLHPLVVILGVTIGGQLGGVFGMLCAVPLISIVKVSLEVLYSYLKSYSII